MNTSTQGQTESANKKIVDKASDQREEADLAKSYVVTTSTLILKRRNAFKTAALSTSTKLLMESAIKYLAQQDLKSKWEGELANVKIITISTQLRLNANK